MWEYGYKFLSFYHNPRVWQTDGRTERPSQYRALHTCSRTEKIGYKSVKRNVKRRVLGFRLKPSEVFAAVTDSGRLHRTFGSATQKARSPNMVPLLETAWITTGGGMNTVSELSQKRTEFHTFCLQYITVAEFRSRHTKIFDRYKFRPTIYKYREMHVKSVIATRNARSSR